ncbi:MULTISPECIES: hypothetical protein [Ralstonia]|jgi:hypothetical protein|uniref:Uncharacterized protein n=1 Tax=Ralstonia mojiangensis TaxID=2953895 RepID=A0AAE3I4H9_9RALS|nr:MULTISPECIES: hypothetical protein [Ralstonia]MCT7317533.1 hypothetical protein [Ralstonia mojiangensis]MCT7328618.1 hypothetical protein [Ralstonia mojiangensis]CAJ0861454.1 hypothetical protein R20233_00869 [Ralstonia sp. LMG 32965]
MTPRQALLAHLGGVLWAAVLIVGAAVTLAAVTRDVLQMLSP